MGAAALARPAGVLMATDADGRAVQIGKAVTSDGRPRLGVQVTSNLVAAHSGRCLDVTGGTDATGNGVPVQQYDCLGSAQTNQVWSFENETVVGGDYYYNIVAAHSGKCLDVTGGNGATGNGVPVQQYDCLGPAAANQQWRMVVFKVKLQLVARHSGKCLDVTGGDGATGNGVSVQQYDCLGLSQSNQMWYRFRP
ncbi:RICIN domain-containing protein [Allorhizocola rhizosphaerae]|uniref:RICIN domain-containing protein n=1 Tax=Allorhizocola rhizosphaerae TaxID=1872709 RepID=UPI0013C35CDE|nr:RICIN domain-containing protein [Allorhizocola rhizosphaerae]